MLTRPSPEPKRAGAAAFLPAGTVLYLRLQAAVSTKTSAVGQAVAASVAREVAVPDGVAIPLGAIVTGSIVKCAQPSKPDERAELLLSFTAISIPGERTLSLTGRVSGVSNARETLLSDGTIVGVLASEVPASLLTGALQKLGALDPSIAAEIQKERIGEVNTDIEYPAGTDFQFTLAQPLAVDRLFASTGPGRLPASLRTSLAAFLSNAPRRSMSKENKPGDPFNLILIGTAQEIEQAFGKGGWRQPKARNAQSIAGTVLAMVNDEGYSAAPISNLYLYGRKQDAAFERMLNTFDKRHHLRLWQAAERAPDGRPIWLGAATHDTGIDIHPGAISHATDPSLDDEREQVGSDLRYSGAVQALELVAPPHPLASGQTATGGAWRTDGRLLAIDLKPVGAATQP